MKIKIMTVFSVCMLTTEGKTSILELMVYAINEETCVARPIKCRRICSMPKAVRFRPESCGREDAVTMSYDELEILRLIDYENLKQDEAASCMEIARATVQQIYAEARRKCAIALVEARPLVIEGGAYRICERAAACTRPCGLEKTEDAHLVAFPVDEESIEGLVCPVFSRARYFAFLDKDGTLSYASNPAHDAKDAAALDAIRFLLEKGICALSAVCLGVRAFAMLEKAEVSVLQSGGGTLGDDIKCFQAGQLEALRMQNGTDCDTEKNMHFLHEGDTKI